MAGRKKGGAFRRAMREWYLGTSEYTIIQFLKRGRCAVIIPGEWYVQKPAMQQEASRYGYGTKSFQAANGADALKIYIKEGLHGLDSTH